MDDGFLPDIISSDITAFNVNGPAFDLPTTMAKFLHLGLTLQQVVERTTTACAAAVRLPCHAGILAVGEVADISLLRLQEGEFDYTDSLGETRAASVGLVAELTVRNGVVVHDGRK